MSENYSNLQNTVAGVAPGTVRGASQAAGEGHLRAGSDIFIENSLA